MPTKKTSTFAAIVTVLAVVFGSFVVRVGHALFDKPANVDELLVQTSNEVNKKLPMVMADNFTRLDGVYAAPNKAMIYKYTLLGVSSTDVDKGKFVSVARQKAVDFYKTSPSMSRLRALSVTLRHQYFDQNGLFILEVAVGPNDL